MGQGALYRPQSCRMGSPKVHVRESVDARHDRAESRLHSEQAARQQISRARVRCKPADGRQRHAGAGVARGGLDRHRGRLFRLLAYEQHVVEPFEVPAHWARFRSMDWGSARPFSVGWWAIVGDDHCLSIQGASRIIPRGALLRYREWYGAAGPNVGLKMTAEAVADGIVERERSDAALRYGVLDPACFQEDGGPSIAERINKGFIAGRQRPFHAADNRACPQRGSWAAGISCDPASSARMAAHDLLLHRDARIRTIPALPHDSPSPKTSTPRPRTTRGTSGATPACPGRLCGCP